MSPIVGLLLVLFGLVVLESLHRAARELRTAYRVLSTPTGRVSDLLTDPEGPIELRGTARAADEVVSGPFTGEVSLLCETRVEEYRSSRYGGSWREIDSGSWSVPFLLEDDSGSVLVDPRGADVRLGSDVVRIGVDGGSAPPERIRRYVDAHGLSCENRRLDLGPLSIPRGADRRYTERRIRPGAELYVLGRARPEATGVGSVDAVVGDGSDACLIGEGSARRNVARALRRSGVAVGQGAVVAVVALVLALVLAA